MFAYSFYKFKVKIMFTVNVSLILRWLIFWKRWLLVLNGVSLSNIILRRLVIERKNYVTSYMFSYNLFIRIDSPLDFQQTSCEVFIFFSKYFIKLIFDLNSKNHPPISILIVLLKHIHNSLCTTLPFMHIKFNINKYLSFNKLFSHEDIT